ncbi:hypothetical protein MTO96_024794 [Rhipicephalus appendiculatus]
MAAQLHKVEAEGAVKRGRGLASCTGDGLTTTQNGPLLRAATTEPISSATEALQAEHPSSSDSQVIWGNLHVKDSVLATLSDKLRNNGDEYWAEVVVAVAYRDDISHSMSRVRFLPG